MILEISYHLWITTSLYEKTKSWLTRESEYYQVSTGQGTPDFFDKQAPHVVSQSKFIIKMQNFNLLQTILNRNLTIYKSICIRKSSGI